MLGNLVTALGITIIGMGLVFAIILLLWGVMVLLTRLTDREKVTPSQSPSIVEVASLSVESRINIRMIRAAAAAVA